MSDNGLRHLFPIFAQHQKVAGAKPWVYLDSAATSQKPKQVIDTIERYYRLQNANVHRASHQVALDATLAFEQVRTDVQKFINSGYKEEIIWTKGATESINLVASCLEKGHFRKGQRILLSTTEHHANIVPWQMAAERLDMVIDVIPVDENGVWQLEAGLALITENTAMVALGHVSNALGNINPIEPLIAKAKQVDALTLIDGAQAAAHLPIDVQRLDCDFYVFSGHKMFAPTGIGVLYGKKHLLESMPPYQYGGEMIEKVSFTGTRFQALPFKFEAGTPNIEGVLGLGAAIAFINAYREQIQSWEMGLYQYLMSKLNAIEKLRLWGDSKASTAVQSFTVEGIANQDLGILLDEQNIACRVGHHCAMPLMEALNISGTIRVSLSCYNTLEDIDYFIQALESAINQVSSVQAGGGSSPLNEERAGKQAFPLAEKVKNSQGWDQVYRQVMLAGKQMTRLNPDHKTAENEVFGCESQVWLMCEPQGDRLKIHADSPSKIVRGLLAILFEPLGAMTRDEIATFDADVYLKNIGLARHLSPSRGNGLRAVVEKIKGLAQS